jgi:hypothetical protein
MAPHTFTCQARGSTVLSNAWWTMRQRKIDVSFFCFGSDVTTFFNLINFYQIGKCALALQKSLNLNENIITSTVKLHKWPLLPRVGLLPPLPREGGWLGLWKRCHQRLQQPLKLCLPCRKEKQSSASGWGNSSIVFTRGWHGARCTNEIKRDQKFGSVEGTLKFFCYWLVNFYQFARRKICCSEW